MFQLGSISAQREAQMLIEGGDLVFASPSSGFKYHVIRQSQTINVYIGGEVELLLVGGGGGGGHGYQSGGGGAGGVVKVPSYIVSPGSYSAVIGEGGAGAVSYGAFPPYGGGVASRGTSGNNTTFLGFTALGGGGGGTNGIDAADGGSGGGAGSTIAGSATQTATTQNSTPVVPYGNDGGPLGTATAVGNEGGGFGGGGGGAGSAGGTRTGGDGLEYQSYTVFKFAGGGRAGYTDWNQGPNEWGAGAGSYSTGSVYAVTYIPASSAVANSGSGGGGGSANGGPYYSYYSTAGSGGSGLIIMKYRFTS